MRLEIEGDIDENGMIMDYYEIQKIISPLIDRLDHSFCVDSNDTLMLNFLKENGFKHYIINSTTTAENLAKHILEIVNHEFQSFSNLKLLKIRVNETADVFAEIEINL